MLHTSLSINYSLPAGDIAWAVFSAVTFLVSSVVLTTLPESFPSTTFLITVLLPTTAAMQPEEFLR